MAVLKQIKMTSCSFDGLPIRSLGTDHNAIALGVPHVVDSEFVAHGLATIATLASAWKACFTMPNALVKNNCKPVNGLELILHSMQWNGY